MAAPIGIGTLERLDRTGGEVTPCDAKNSNQKRSGFAASDHLFKGNFRPDRFSRR